MNTLRVRWPALIAASFLLPFAGRPGLAEEEPAPAPEPAPAEGAEEPKDEADDKVPFVEEVNKSIDQGVKWLLARPKLFTTGKSAMAHWGLVKGASLYGGGEGPGYGMPAGTTALSVYTLLKCGVPPTHPTIVEGFNWLRAQHPVTEEYDGHGAPVGFSWSHSDKLVPSSYELSTMILALTAKYDRWKRGKNSQAAAQAGKLRIKDPADLEWLQAMVGNLVERRGHPVAKGKADKREGRLGWRYNQPILTLSRGGGRGGGGGTSSTREIKRPPHANQDLSSTQLATLALFSARRFGVETKPEVWFDIVEFTLSHQEEEGPEHERFDPGYKAERYAGGSGVLKDHARGFMYLKGSPDKTEGIATGAMTACGVANLLMAREVLGKDSKTLTKWKEMGLDKKVETAIWDGLAWLDLNWSPLNNPSGGNYHVYYLYALERAMDLLGKNLVGSHPWYPDCAKELLAIRQRAQVKVRAEGGKEVEGVFWNMNASHDPKDVLDTCFALLFLKRATKDLIPTPPTITHGD
jgi:hypothetical protein